MAPFQSITVPEWQLFPSRFICSSPPGVALVSRSSPAAVLHLRINPSLFCKGNTRPWPPTSLLCSCKLKQISNQCQRCRLLSGKEQRMLKGGNFLGLEWSAFGPSCAAGKIARVISPTTGMKDRDNKGMKKAGKRKSKMKEQIQEVFHRVGLERQFGQLPEWSAYVPVVAAGLEAMVILSWTIALKGDLQGSSLFNLSGEGLLSLLLGVNFVVGWLASQMSTWSVQALPATSRGPTRRAASPGMLQFLRSFAVSAIPYGNFLAWVRLAWKENSPVSSVNALVYVVPSVVRLVLWSQGLTLGRVEQIAWILGTIHRPFDVARVKNEKVLAVANEKIEAARKAKEEKEQEGKAPELTIDEIVLLQQRKELEDFDRLLAKSTNSTHSVPGAPQDWSVGDTIQWLSQAGFARYASTFAGNDIDGPVLLQLTAEDLRNDLGIQSLGDRRKLGQAIDRLKATKYEKAELPLSQEEERNIL